MISEGISSLHCHQLQKCGRGTYTSGRGTYTMVKSEVKSHVNLTVVYVHYVIIVLNL